MGLPRVRRKGRNGAQAQCRVRPWRGRGLYRSAESGFTLRGCRGDGEIRAPQTEPVANRLPGSGEVKAAAAAETGATRRGERKGADPLSCTGREGRDKA